ncbi:hypothetical protein [Prauserella flavalba]|uniref:SH3 domain-containing protein n=1 Tax=Prauserella flavalba TaxID=1477506 RepID=A0A318LHG8_9PSEU|nr:hypothetical protein [Prauserella flavalba]PXY20554.1 hypothetical protein BA062_32540 [Prauserella flavalba]
MQQHTTRRLAVLAALSAATLMFAGVASAAAAPAETGDAVSTMSCSHSHSNKDADHGYVDADWLKRRSGPHTSCEAWGQEPRGTKIYYHCYVITDGGDSWTWGRVAGTQKQGWFNDDYLSDGGSLEEC